MKYVFVGDRPAKKNVSPKVAFLGTKSYVTLMHWIGHMQLHYSQIEIINRADVPYYVGRSEQYKFVALGNEAEKELEEFNLDYFKLPHPSGLNRKLNDKEYVRAELRKCKEYLRGD